MEAFLSPSRPVNRYFGVYPAIVVDNVDPEQRYRVKVKFPWLMESDEKYVDKTDKEEMRSTWARIASPLMGTNKHEGTLADELRGWIGIPEIDDEVLVVFAFGDFRDAIVIAQMSNGKDLPFWQNKEAKGVQIAEKNCLRGLRSRSGHMISFVDLGKDDADKIVLQTQVKDDFVYDQPALGEKKEPVKAIDGDIIKIDVPDGEIGTHLLNMDMTPGKEHVLLSDRDGKLLIKFDSVDQTMILYSEKDMVIHAKKNLHLMCESLKIESEKGTELKAGTTWKQESGGTMDLEAGATMTLKGGPDIQLNP